MACRFTVAGKKWDQAYRKLCHTLGLGHLISVTPELETYKFGNGGLLQSHERVTVPVVLAQTPMLISYSVVDSPVLSLLVGRDAIENLGIDILGSRKVLRLG